ncbi:MAG: radical SAM protein [Candidatus Heimdallarchaeota archaeon]|nr:radical SAM protein [Candidatus Heimdallarchaeota archaeon]
MSTTISTKPLDIIDYSGEKSIMEKLVSVNYHLIKSCNYRCKFCFAHFNQLKGNYLSKEKSLKLISELSRCGTKKITFVGGEPTLVPFLPELAIHAKSLGMTTMIVTNGTKISENYIRRFKGSLDWVGLSIDSSIEEINKKLGRGSGGHVRQTLDNVEVLRKFGIKIKINTVVNQLNFNEDMSELILGINPLRWKVFQMLPIEGENEHARDLLIDKNQFELFLKNNQKASPVKESNDDMTDSYVMIDPEGRFYNNSDGKLNHGPSILTVGVERAFALSKFQLEKFENRGGRYNW